MHEGDGLDGWGSEGGAIGGCSEVVQHRVREKERVRERNCYKPKQKRERRGWWLTRPYRKKEWLDGGNGSATSVVVREGFGDSRGGYQMVEKNESEAIWRIAALQKVLKEVHSLFLMFHGSIRALLEKEPAGGLIRAHLHPFMMDYLRDFLFGKKLLLPSFRDCLKERGTVQMLTVSREAAIEVQSLVRLLESCAGNSPCYSLILFQDLLVSTTLSPVDTINLFTYAVLRLTPRTLSSGVSSWSYLRKGSTGSSVAAGYTLASSASVPDQYYCLPDTSLGGDNNYHVVRPLKQDRWFKAKDGFLVTDIWSAEAGSSTSATPTIWLQQTGERMYLCAYQFRSLTLILVVPVASILNGEQLVSLLKQQVLENASLKMLKVEEKLSKGWGGENAYHVSGYRYLLVDVDRNVSRASPPGKVTTLTKESLLALSMVREEVDLEKGQMAWDKAGQEKDLELCIRAKNNAWVIARIAKGKELYMVLEKANETVLYASDAVEKFSNRSISLLYSFVSFKKGKKNNRLRVFVHQFVEMFYLFVLGPFTGF